MERREMGKNCIKDQRGFTLVELLIGMVILSIVTASVCAFIVVGSRSYAAANTEIMLQQEAQLAMNQISDVIIDTTRSVNYAGFLPGEGLAQKVEKDADFTFDPQYKSLAMFNGAGSYKLDAGGNKIPVLDETGNPKVDKEGNTVYEMEIETGSGNQKNYQFYWDRENQLLYYSEIDVDKETFPGIGEEGCVVLAEYVTEFNVDLTQVEEKRVVQISMTFQRENKTYHTSNNITIRNKVRVNEVELKQLDKQVILQVIPKESSVILEPGEEYHFSTPLVTGQNIMNKGVTWSKSAEAPPGSGATDFMDEANGIIKIGSDETADSFEVIITTDARDSKGNPATAKVTVYVKRAKTAALYKSEDENTDNGSGEVSPGKTFTVSASVEGNKLGVPCGGCDDATTKDKYVVADEYPMYGWQIIRGADLVTMESGDHKTATFRVSPDAKKGDEIEIQAASLLSVEKGYTKAGGSGVVYGTITLKVAETSVDIHWSGDFKYGDEPLTVSWDYSSHYSLICARIKTNDPNAPMSEDKVMIYDSDGKAIRVGADLFGLNLDHNYYISIQVLDYALDKNAPDYAAKRDAIVAEYNGHLDSTGTYVGEIPSSSKVTVPLLKPQFTVSYNGKNYEGQQVDVQMISALSPVSPVYVSCPLVAISSTRSEGERVLNESKCNVYTGTGTDSSGWTPLWTYQENGGSYTGSGRVGGLWFESCGVHKPKELCITIDKNNNGMINAVGSYHYVPFFKYSNAADAQRYNVHWHNYEPDYDTHYYYRPESAINFEIAAKGNLDLWAFTTSNYFVKGEIYFPLPSESKFAEYFALQNTSMQETSQWNEFQMLGADGGNYGVQFSRMACKYYAIDDVYEIELFYRFKNPVWDYDMEKSAGRFRCAADGKEWSRLDKGSLDDQFVLTGQSAIPLYNGPIQLDGSNISFVMKDNNGNPQNVKAYIPLPADAGFTGNGGGQFGFVLQQDGVQTVAKDGLGFKYQVIGTTGINSRNCKQIRCFYDKNTDTYTLELTASFWFWNAEAGYHEETETITVTCKSTDTRWTAVK